MVEVIPVEVEYYEDEDPEEWNENQIKRIKFYKRNRTGKVRSVTRDKYLRTDLHCGSYGCKECPLNMRSGINLDSDPPLYSTKYKHKHYLLPDSSFLIRQLDVVEELSNVILLQIVMEDICRTNTTKYKRIRESFKNKNWNYFLNEHHIDTYVEREPGESEEDRESHAFIVAYEYFIQHFQPLGITVVILSDNPDFNSKYFKYLKSKGKEPVVATAESYVKNLVPQFQDLEDKLCKIPFNEDESVKKFPIDFAFAPHLPSQDVQDGIRTGKFLQGPYRSWNFYEGSVRIEVENGESREILLQGLENINRACDGDIVAVEILEKELWSVPSGIVMDEDEEELPLTSDAVVDVELDETEGEIQTIVAEIVNDQKSKSADVELKVTGKVVGIIRRKWLPCTGRFRKSHNENSLLHFLFPDNRKIPRIKLETRNASRLDGKKLLVQIDSWPVSSKYPYGHIVKVLGFAGSVETETSAILYEHGIPHGAFTKAVEACLPTLPFIIPPEEYKRRIDFRSLLVVSIDPPGCTDIDDALHSKLLPDGNYEVGVHIADVSYFIEPETALDVEAAKRSTSVYLHDRRINMIPPLLSTNLCSLHANTDKLVFSVIWKLKPTGQIIDTKFVRGVINSKAALTYDEAQAQLNSTASDPITESLRRLSLLAQVLKKERFARGALMLSSAEVRDEGDSDINSEEAHSLVEEFMLLANCAVAKFTLNSFREYALLRRHPLPPPSNFEPLLLAAKGHGMKLIVDQGSKALNDSIENQKDEIKGILRVMTTRCMTQALYCCSGTSNPLEYRHFGLAVDLYTHFTSPIRRYADLMVHRLLAIALGVADPDPRILVAKKIDSICENINTRHRMAQYASRASNNWHKSQVLLKKEEEEEGYIMCIRRNALQIFVPKYGMDGFVFFPKSVQFQLNEKEGTVEFGKILLRPLDKVTIAISLKEDRDKVSLRLVEPNIPGLTDK